jgi:predicted thioredoxin/glutaredoxin
MGFLRRVRSDLLRGLAQGLAREASVFTWRTEGNSAMRLEIYVADHCDNCAEALRLAELARPLPGVEVLVVNLDTTTDPVPARVVAVPTYMLDGRVVSLGNPSREGLLRLLGQAHRVCEEVVE